MEVWKNINDHYRVSNLGNVESCKMGYWKSMKKAKLPRGYCQINLCNNNNIKHHYVHRLVATAFISNPLNEKAISTNSRILYITPVAKQ